LPAGQYAFQAAPMKMKSGLPFCLKKFSFSIEEFSFFRMETLENT